MDPKSLYLTIHGYGGASYNSDLNRKSEVHQPKIRGQSQRLNNFFLIFKRALGRELDKRRLTTVHLNLNALESIIQGMLEHHTILASTEKPRVIIRKSEVFSRTL